MSSFDQFLKEHPEFFAEAAKKSEKKIDGEAIGTAIGTSVNRITGTLFWIFLVLKVLGLGTFSWWLVAAPIIGRWAFIVVCLIILAVTVAIRERRKAKNA